MSLFGKQHRFCPNCGKPLYDNSLNMNHVLSMMCSDACRHAWEIKHAKVVLGQTAPELVFTPELIASVEQYRWDKGIPHDLRSEKIVRALVELDFHGFDDRFGWKVGGDGDNGEALMYELDAYFELLDRTNKEPL